MAISWKEAAIVVLRNNADGMHYLDITKRIIDQGLITDFGATPAASLAATLSLDMKNNPQDTIFERIGKAKYRLKLNAQIPEIKLPKNIVQRVNAESDSIDEEEIDYGFINAYGMYWDRDLIDWNKKPGELYGRQKDATISVNFADQDGVYLLYNNETVIYVGKANTSSMFERLRSHTSDRLQQRWNKFSWFGVKPVDGNGKLLQSKPSNLSADDLVSTLEALLIEAVEPNQNRQAGKGFGLIEFFQIADKAILLEKARKILSQV